MKNISICVGSSCHLKGSYKIIELAKDYIAIFDEKVLVCLD